MRLLLISILTIFLVVLLTPNVFGEQKSVLILSGTADDMKMNFFPSVIEIEKGDTIIWKNLERGVVHTVTSASGLFNERLKNCSYFQDDVGICGGHPKSVFSYTFEEFGTYDYNCKLHNWMNGVVYVNQAPFGSPDSPSSLQSKTSTFLKLDLLDNTFRVEDLDSRASITFSGQLLKIDRQSTIPGAVITFAFTGFTMDGNDYHKITTDNNGKFDFGVIMPVGEGYAVQAVYDGSLNFEPSKSQTEYFDVRPVSPPPQVSPPQVSPPTEDPGDNVGGVFLLVIIMVVVIVAIAIKKRKKRRPDVEEVTIQTSSSRGGFEEVPESTIVFTKPAKVPTKPAGVLPKPEKKPKTVPKQKPRKETKKSSVKKAKKKFLAYRSSDYGAIDMARKRKEAEKQLIKDMKEQESRKERKEVPHGSEATEAEKQWIKDHEMTESELEQYIKDTKDTQKYDDDGNLRSEEKSADRWNKNKKQNILKVCPKCGRRARTEKEMQNYFGYRMMGGARRPQSWCRACRTDKETRTNSTKKPTKQKIYYKYSSDPKQNLINYMIKNQPVTSGQLVEEFGTTIFDIIMKLDSETGGTGEIMYTSDYTWVLSTYSKK